MLFGAGVAVGPNWRAGGNIHATHSYKDVCPTMFIAALFVLARTWKQPKCPSSEELMEKMWSIYTMETTQWKNTMKS